MDFKDYINADVEYEYNANGAMTKDLNKGISDIQYNLLNLPRIMDIKSPVAEARNEYTYSAAGQKLKVVQKWNPNYSTAPVIGSAVNVSSLSMNKTTDYIGNMIYEDGTLKFILIDGGYIENGLYYYYQTDHLGNNRVVADASGAVVQKNHYYPFGIVFAETSVAEQGMQPYKFGGKELDQMNGLNLYDNLARLYDPSSPHTLTPDPLCWKHYSISPYSWCGNNPVNLTDPSGKDVVSGVDWISYTGSDVLMAFSQLKNMYESEYDDNDKDKDKKNPDPLVKIDPEKKEASADEVLPAAAGFAEIVKDIFTAVGTTISDAALGGFVALVGILTIKGDTDPHQQYNNSASDNNKNEKHGDGGRAKTKVEKQIDDLENQLQGATGTEKAKIKQKIKNIRENAERKEKGEEHSRDTKR